MTTNASVAWAMSDMAPSEDGRIPAGVVSVPEPNGCGRQHRAQVDDNGRPYIKCPVCAPWLVGHSHGFANTPAGVPLTPDEQGEVEISKRQGEVSYQLAMKAMGQAMGNMIQGQAGANPAAFGGRAPVSLKEQLASLSAGERAELAAMLTAGPVPPAPADVKDAEPRTAEHPAAGPPAEAEPAPKRGGSRTRVARAD